MIEFTVYRGFDNPVYLSLRSEKVPISLAAVTRAVLKVGKTPIVIDSRDVSGVFNWSTGVTGRMALTLGHQAIAVGSYKVVLVTYDSVNDDGIVWPEMRMIVKDERFPTTTTSTTTA
jgi:hypothetical protein